MRKMYRTSRYKTQIYILMFIFIIYVIYSFRLPITIKAMGLYGKVSKNPNIERIIGECYFSLSYESGQTAQKYFKIALDKYIYQHKHSNHDLTNDKDYHTIEYVIGNSYEYGKGTPKNLLTAKLWYKKAARGGNVDARISLDRLNKSIQLETEDSTQETNE